MLHASVVTEAPEASLAHGVYRSAPPPTGSAFGGGTLQFGASFNLAGTRAITLNAGGGTIDTGSFATTIRRASPTAAPAPRLG